MENIFSRVIVECRVCRRGRDASGDGVWKQSGPGSQVRLVAFPRHELFVFGMFTHGVVDPRVARTSKKDKSRAESSVTR